MTELPTPVVVAFVVLAVIAVVHTVILAGLLRMVSHLYGAVLPGQGPATDYAGKEAPLFVAESLTGSVIDSATFTDRMTALLFVAPSCEGCEATLDELEVVRARAAGNVFVVCTGGAEDCTSLVEKLQPVEVIHDRDGRIRRLFEVKKTPTAVLIGKGGRIQSYGEPDRGELQTLVNQA